MANFANRFALLGGEDDDDAPASAPAPAAPANEKKAASGDKAQRGGRGEQRGGRGAGGYPSRDAPRKVFKDNSEPRAADEGPVGDDPVKDDRGGAPRGRGRGRGGPRGARGAARGGAAREGGAGGYGRPDRHSQTDTVDSDKKEHQGWGGDEGKRELEDEDWGATDAQLEKAAQTPTKATHANGDNTPTQPTEPQAPVVEAEPEDNSKTYEEYLAERAAQAQNVGPVLSARKPNEGADEEQWKNGTPLAKTENDNFFVGKQAQAKARKAKEDKRTFIEIEPLPVRREGGGDRGDRGGRGGRGRGGPRGGRGGFSDRGGRDNNRSNRSNQQAPVNTADTNAFPSL